MRRLLVSVGVAAAIGLTACGGSSTKTVAAATTTLPATTAPPSTIALGNDQANTPFCMLAKTYTDKYSGLLNSLTDPTKLKAAATDAESAIRQAQATAPAAIKADVTVVATTASQVLAALQKVSFMYAKADPTELAKLTDPTFTASLGRLTAYGQAHCGIS